MKKFLLFPAVLVLLASCSFGSNVRPDMREKLYGNLSILFECTEKSNFEVASHYIAREFGEMLVTNYSPLDFTRLQDKLVTRSVCAKISSITAFGRDYRIDDYRVTGTNPAVYHLTLRYSRLLGRRRIDFSFVYIPSVREYCLTDIRDARTIIAE